jgi:hypothetical protein
VKENDDRIQGESVQEPRTQCEEIPPSSCEP